VIERRKLRTLAHTSVFYGTFSIAAPTLAFGVLPPFLLAGRVDPRVYRLLWRVARRYYRFFLGALQATGAIRMDVHYADRVDFSRPAVFVANHRTLLDVLILLALVPDATCLLKSTALRAGSEDAAPRGTMPGIWTAYISAAVKGLGYIPMPGNWNDHRALLRVLRECREALVERQRSLIIFPEGTRSPGAHMLPFLDLPFKAAVEAGVPVVPVVIHVDRPFMPKGSNWIDVEQAARYRVEFLEPIEPGPRVRTKDLSYESRRAIGRRLRRMDAEFGSGLEA